MTRTILQNRIRTYSELCLLNTFQERFEYLRLDGQVGQKTFGFERYLNQQFYHSSEWRSIRDRIIVRDLGCDLGVDGYTIYGKVYIHHMNPIQSSDVTQTSDYLINPEFLICTTHNTHNAIHYGDVSLLVSEPIERKPNDTCPWKKE